METHISTELPLWGREEKPITNNDDEESVEKAWGDCFFDARTHPSFKSFAQHLSNHSLWDVMLEIQNKYNIYEMACIEAYSDIQNKLRPISKRLTKESFQLMSERIYLFCNEHLLSLDCYEVGGEEEMEADRIILSDGTKYHPLIAKRLEATVMKMQGS